MPKQSTEMATEQPLLRIKRINRTPPGDWYYICHDEFMVKGRFYEELVSRVARHYKANGEEVPGNLGELVQHQICQRVPESICAGHVKKHFFPTIRQIESGTRVLLDIWRQGGAALCEQDEAERRAKVCVECKWNIRLTNCKGCVWAYRIVRRAFQGRGTSMDGRLHACAICGCLNTAQIHCTSDVLQRSTRKDMIEHYPDHCWKKAILMENRNEN